MRNQKKWKQQMGLSNLLALFEKDNEMRLLSVIREKKRLKPRSSIAQAIDFRR